MGMIPMTKLILARQVMELSALGKERLVWSRLLVVIHLRPSVEEQMLATEHQIRLNYSALMILTNWCKSVVTTPRDSSPLLPPWPPSLSLCEVQPRPAECHLETAITDNQFLNHDLFIFNTS